MAERVVPDIRVGSLVAVTGCVGGTHKENLMCELRAVAFNSDGVRFVVWSLETERPHLVDPREVDVDVVCGPVEADDEPADDGEGLDGAPGLALSMLAFAGAVIALAVAEAMLGFWATVGLGAAVVGAAALFRRNRGGDSE